MIYVPAHDGSWVDENFARLAEIVKEYDAWLELRWIPPDKRLGEDRNPYAIWDTRTNTPVFFANQVDSPVDILARLLSADNKYGSVLNRLEAANLAQERFNRKIREDVLAEAREEVAFLVGSPKNYIKHRGKKLDDQRRPIL